ncbi:MAG: hypothetical protein K2W94_07235 [Alphaproteobacteria bacterium]|nr:hypothetical protein [Alphaproteobacteria bacterium]
MRTSVWYPKKLSKDHIGLTGALLFVLGFFWYSVQLRAPYFGVLSGGHHWLSGSTLEFATNWYREGIFHLKFLMLENPASIEFGDLNSRSPYVSYPCGAPLQLYLLSCILGKEPTAGMLMGLNLFHHLAISSFLASIVWIALSREYLLLRVTCSVFAGTSYLLLPVPMYYHQNVFFADQAVIFYFVVAVLLEVMRDYFKGSLRTIDIFQAIIVFLGCLTDWLMVFVAGTIFLKRIINNCLVGNLNFSKLKSDFISVFLPVSLSIFLFMLQIFLSGHFQTLYSRFMFRSGLGTEGASQYTNFIHDFWLNSLGEKPTNLFLKSLILPLLYLCYLWSKKLVKKEKMALLREDHYLYSIPFMLTLPCLLQVYVFQNHSVVHDFSRLKFFIPLSVVPFIFLPLLIKVPLTDLADIALKRKTYTPYKDHISKLLKFLCVIFQLVILINGKKFISSHMNMALFLQEDVEFKNIASTVREKMNYNSVVFSPHMEIPKLPPQLLALSMKRVHKVEKKEDISAFLKQNLENKKPDIYVIVLNNKEETLERQLKGFILEETSYATGFRILKIKDPR